MRDSLWPRENSSLYGPLTPDAGSAQVTREALAEAAADFLPSVEGAEKDLQETAAVLECTDRHFLPPPLREEVDAPGGRALMQERYLRLRQLVERS